MPLPGSPLPRLWKAEPDPPPTPEKNDSGTEEDKGKPAAKSKKKKAEKPEKERPAKSVLLEETPEFDTYETRQKIRIVIGVVAAGLFLLIGFVIYRVLVPRSTEEVTLPNETIATTPAGGIDRERAEIEAKSLLERARNIARNGNAELAISLLQRLKTTYPGTRAAREAGEALDRPKQNLPLFLDSPAVVAKQAEPSVAKEPAAEVKVVEARAPDVPGTRSAEANLVLPVNPAEPGSPSPTNLPPPAPVATQTTRPLPPGFRARPGTAVHASGWPVEIVGDRDGAPMVLVPGGSFTMGRDDGEPPEAPAHSVTLATFYIDRHEVTLRQYALFLKETGHKDSERQRALAREASGGCDSEDCPVVMVSAAEARDFAKWAGKALPTEAQWEMAARGSDGRLYPWGMAAPTWERKREPKQIDPVMSFPSDVSPFGVYDMAGNVMEWTKDWFDPRYYYHFRKTPAVDPTGPTRTRTVQLSVKGGAKNWIITKRDGIKPESRLATLGFRCVLQAETPQAAPPVDASGQPGGAGVPTTVPF
jgi:formylglycine-generating enzyme required for sulfatase activity